MYEIKLPNGMTVKVVPPEEYRDFISESDAEMDYRAGTGSRESRARNRSRVMTWIQKGHI